MQPSDCRLAPPPKMRNLLVAFHSLLSGLLEKLPEPAKPAPPPEVPVQSSAATVADYLASLPDDRRVAIQAVRDVFKAHLDAGYEEGMQYGMIGYYVPHHIYPAGYHCDRKQPLPFAGLASQKGHMSLYLMGLYMSPGMTDWFQSEWIKAGKKLDMGKACVRFKKLDALALDVLGEALRRLPVADYIRIYETNLKK